MTLEQMVDQIERIRELLTNVLDQQSRQFTELMAEIARLKETQSEILAKVSLIDRLQVHEQSRDTRKRPPRASEGHWEGIQGYCIECTALVLITQATQVLRDGRPTIEGKCAQCGSLVSRLTSWSGLSPP